jgi:hypothetical protein
LEKGEWIDNRREWVAQREWNAGRGPWLLHRIAEREGGE